ncbi:MAG: FAD-binding protein [Chloroflexia bacterium]|nr:FAD-binding protein [Chloroflexia bacterium]
MSRELNWAGNYAYRATQLHRPATIDELRAVVAGAPRIHTLGSRHSFNDIADAAELVSLDALDPAIEIDREAMTVTCGGATRYGDLAQTLEAAGLALHNMASLPHISVAGAISTATHGSGDALGNLATAVSAIELVTSSGDIIGVTRGHADFDGMVVGLGAIGVIYRLTLDLQPSYMVRQEVFEDLAWETLFDRFHEVFSSATSVSLFTDWGATINTTWLKSRILPDGEEPLRADLMGALAATKAHHPLASMAASSCTDQLGLVGPWSDRLPHFRMDAVPASGEEIQAEYMFAREHAVAALRALLEIADRIRPLLLISEVRSVAADTLWMSTAYGRDTVCVHFSFKPDVEAVTRFLPELEAALESFDVRPHWGKVFAATARELEPRYPRIADFKALAERLDPRGAFRSDFLERTVFG